MVHRFRRPALMLMCLCGRPVGTTMAWAAITGAISGIITDPTGAVVPGVTVIATEEATGIRTTCGNGCEGVL